MRGFLGKIFLCMLLVPILARGMGIALESTLNDPRPQSERTLALVLPALADLAGQVYRASGPDAVARSLRASQGVVRLLPVSSGCLDRFPHAMAAPLPGAPNLCLAAMPPPRPLVLGLVPASWWFLLPVLELLIAGVISFFLARYLAEPILRTRAAAAAFAAGDLAARASAAGARHDEAADLEREFNRMADRVAGMIAAQQRFIGDVSHEVRSPLGRLALTLGLARRDAAPELLPKLDRMEYELDNVSRLVRELLVLATLQGDVGPPTNQAVAVSDIIGQVIEDLSFEFHDRAQSIRVVRRNAGVLVRGDGALLRRAIENVLRNALFYTPDTTPVEILLEADASWARVVVRDHGPGVPEKALPQLFDPFFRVDQARARNTGGVGLGLSISQRAVELHGGRISASNVPPHGLAVRIELPVLVGQKEESASC